MEKKGEDREETGRGSFPLPLWGNSSKKVVVWSVAGFDPSSGAGVTADLMTFAAHGLFGCSAITALTVQSTLGVFGWEAVAPEPLRSTLQRLQEDVPAAGIKVGMLASPEVAVVVGEFLKEICEGGENRRPVVVYDPVLRSSSGRDLFPASGLLMLHDGLLPLVDWITPNWAELEVLSGRTVSDLATAEAAARGLMRRYPELTVVATGGEGDRPDDLLVEPGKEAVLLEGRRILTRSTHGTGCAFSSALLARLVEGYAPDQAVKLAKIFVEGALRHAPGVGQGRGPMALLWPLREGLARVATLEE